MKVVSYIFAANGVNLSSSRISSYKGDIPFNVGRTLNQNIKAANLASINLYVSRCMVIEGNFFHHHRYKNKYKKYGVGYHYA